MKTCQNYEIQLSQCLEKIYKYPRKNQNKLNQIKKLGIELRKYNLEKEIKEFNKDKNKLMH